MRELCLWFVLILLSCVLATPEIKNCSDCIMFKHCDIARELLAERNNKSDAKITNAFCGRDSYTDEVKVCCSELSNITPATRIGGDSVEGHPSLELLPESCGRSDDGNKIIGGHVAGLYQYPWMALIGYERRGEIVFRCGGSVINERYVLTAAHCVKKPVVSVRVGEHDIDATTDCQGHYPHLLCESHIQDIAVESVLPHPKYGQNKHDIALLRLKNSVDMNHNNVGAICLPVTKELQNRDLDVETAAVAGWGITEGGYSSSKLLTVDVPVHTSQSCAEYLIQHKGIADTEDLLMICAGAVGKDTCGGDSGGPLMLKGVYNNLGERYIQYGVVSGGPPRCGTDEPGRYSDVTKDVKWILDNILP